MVTVTEQYDAYPYPTRDPAEEARRLIVGSPSRPAEMDHFLWGGRRDWSKPLRVLVAGGGSGDGTVQLAQLLTDAKRPYEITYLDLSGSARRIAEARLAARGLSGVTFHTASLLDAPDFGLFDYIDCCGVLHHLPAPGDGFAALRAACAPDGGMGMMVYAPHGRAGVYPLQEAFGALLDGLPPETRLARAREIFSQIPESHPFKTNPRLVDHRASDAGFYDLLLHGQDRAFDVASLLHVLEATGWELASFCQPGLYEPERITGTSHALPPATAMAVAEKLRGTMKVHVAYLAPAGVGRKVATGRSLAAIPHLGAPARKLAEVVAKGRPVPLKIEGETVTVTLPRAAAPALARIDGRSTLREIADRAGIGVLEFGALWAKVEAGFAPWGLLHYSGVLRR